MKYTAEEVRARLGFVISDREPRILTWGSGGCHPASIAECALWDALAESIEADMGEPVAWLCDNGASENLMVTLSPRGRDAYAALGRTITPLYTHPAPPIDLAAVRDVIDWLRSGSMAITANAGIAANKLEAAIKGVS